MSRDELIKKMATAAGISQKAAGLALAAMLQSIMAACKKDKVSLVGFGSFKRVLRKARNGINPKTKKPIKIPARYVPVFKAGKKFKEAVKK